MSLTKAAGPFFKTRQNALRKLETGGDAAQRSMLEYLVRKASQTEYGKQHGFSSVTDYKQFTANVPLNTYDDLKDSIDRMRHGGRDILWPGKEIGRAHV